ncbi:MAG: alanine racemase [Melioribacteraceae bacterium]|nr:alanine racemase [Melioribacteraceae bacterium]
MTDKARANNIVLRPHFKTHQSIEIGRWFREFGIDKITVSSIDMAKYFAGDGWNDITIAFPANIREAEEINELAEKINLNLLVESVETVALLSIKLKFPVNVFIKIDTDYGRTGIHYTDIELIDKVVGEIKYSDKINLSGFLTHAGHTYKALSRENVSNIHRQSIERLNLLRKKYTSEAGILIVSVGDTPGCTLEDNFEGVDEIRPGNFVFYDVMQYEKNVCASEEIAVCLACPVVAVHKKRREIITYGGAVHLSKDYLADNNNNPYFGLVVKLGDNAWSAPLKDCYVKSLSQEHGVLKMSEREIKNIKPGDLIGVLPVHSCLTANLMKEYRTPEGKIITMMR